MSVHISELSAIAVKAGLNAYEADILAHAAAENAGDVPSDQQEACARSTLESYINGDTRGRDLEALIIHDGHRMSRKWRQLTKNA